MSQYEKDLRPVAEALIELQKAEISGGPVVDLKRNVEEAVYTLNPKARERVHSFDALTQDAVTLGYLYDAAALALRILMEEENK